ncbi:hypothetical protein SUGI_0140700 [Cryptomeria japonica]|nr:hypothetical protein SUGI_0140700 [Cryptomeria japonica]
MSDFYLQNVHAYDDYYEYSQDELDEALDEFLYPKDAKPSFYQKLINLVTMPFRCDEKDKLNDSSQGYIPIISSTKSSNMVVFNNPLYEEISPFEPKDKPFDSYDHTLLDDALDDFVALSKSLNKNKTSKLVNMINLNEHKKPLFEVQGAYPSPTFQGPKSPLLTVQGGYDHDSFLSLPNPQPILPQAPHISQVLSKEYDLIEQLKATPAKISLWDLIQTSSVHHGMLQDALKDLNVPPPNTSSNIASLVNSVMNPKAQIVFAQDELPISEIHHQYDRLMIVVIMKDTTIRRTLVDNGSGLNVCSINLLHKMNVDTSLIEPDSRPIRGFDKLAKNSLGTITLPITVGPVTLPTSIHVMLGNLTYNLLLGRPWINSMQAVPSTLHKQVKFIYNNKTYTLIDDDWGSLDFNPTFVGEYKVPSRELKVEKKEEAKNQSTLPEPMSNNFVAASQTSSPHTSNSEEFDSLSYEKLPSLSEMDDRYGHGFRIFAKHGYHGNGCGTHEQGIKVPLENNLHNYAFGLGYNPCKCTKASKRPCISVNAISTSLSMQHPEYIDEDPSCACAFDVFSTDDALAEFLGAYDTLPRYHHNRGLPYCLNTEAYFGKEIDNDEIVKEFPQLKDTPQQSNLLISDTTNVKMDPCNEERVIKIGKCLDEEEQKQYEDLLHEFTDIFAWTYSDMPGIDPKIVTHNIVLVPDAKPVKQKIQKMNPKVALLVKAEIEKLLEAGFIRPIDYSPWISNIVAVAKLDNKIRVCTDFRDLNNASLKDDFPLPNIDMIVDSTARHALLSFMDGFSGYNQIYINPQDQFKIAFSTPWGTFCWIMMPFGLKNAGATYQ